MYEFLAEARRHMTAYGALLTILLIAPWMLVAVIFVGAALERLQRRTAIGYLLQRAREAGRTEFHHHQGTQTPRMKLLTREK